MAKTTDVSIAVPESITDGKGVKYKQPIVHVALTTVPVVGGLTDFVKLSLDKGKKMTLLQRIAKSLGLKGDADPTEDALVLALETKLKTKDPDPNKDKVLDADAITAAVALALTEKDKTKAPDKEAIAAAVKLALADKAKIEAASANDPLVKLIGENREMKLSNFVKAGLLTPAVKDTIVAKYIEPKTLALELSGAVKDTSFDFLCEVIAANKPVKLDESTGVQTVELANGQKVQMSSMEIDINRRRAAAGLKD